MNITSNYAVKSAQVRSNKIENKSNSQPEINNNSVSFQGLNLKGMSNLIKTGTKKSIKLDKETKEFLDYAGSIIGVPATEMEKHAEGKTVGHMRLLNAMADRYNAVNFGKEASEKEDKNIVLDMFNRIKKPEEEHVGFVNRVKLSITDINKCFNRCEDDPKKISALEDTYIALRGTHKQEDLIKQIVESPNTEEYVTNIDKYLPHFKACEKSEGLIAKLDRKFAAKDSNLSETYDNADINHVLKMFPETSILTKEKLLPNYSSDNVKLINNMRIKFNATKEDLEAGDIKGYLRIYNTTTKENAQFRKDFINANYHNFGQRDRMGKNEVNDLAVILDYADKNPHAKKFMQGLIDAKSGIGSAEGYIELFDKIGAERLSQDVKAIHTLTKNDMLEPAKTVLDYYSTVASKPKNVFSVLLNKLERKAEIKPSSVSVRELMNGDSMDSAIIKRSPRPNIDTILHRPVLPVKPEIKETKVRRTFFKPFVPKAPDAKKLVVINDVNNIIEKTLGSKVLEEQKSIYAYNATKMRAGMLPEIFASIKETRAMERANGTFKKHSSVSNEEAVDLYRRINGKNKKLVNYMLKKTDAQGNRMFSIRDIRETLADANRSILEGQRNSTKSNRFTAKDERAIYDSILAGKVEEFGKLQTKKVKKQ